MIHVCESVSIGSHVINISYQGLWLKKFKKHCFKGQTPIHPILNKYHQKLYLVLLF